MKIYFVVLCVILSQQGMCHNHNMHPSTMVKTVLNSEYQGTLVHMSIPAEVFTRADGEQCARVGAAVPIHCCTDEEVKERSKTTHHYADIFTEETLASLGEVAYVRIDDDTAERVVINYKRSILVTSSDGRLAQWRCAPTFRSANRYMAGAPVVGADGRLLSLLTARQGSDYAVVNIQGTGGYFESPAAWQTVGSAAGLLYADRVLPTREALRDYIASLPDGFISHDGPLVLRPVLHARRPPRLALVAPTGRQAAHTVLPDDVLVTGLHYL